MPSGADSNITDISKQIPDETFHKLLDNSFAVLKGKPETHSLASADPSSKQLYATLLSLTANFVKDHKTVDEIRHSLTLECGLDSPRLDEYLRRFDEHRIGIEAALLNIGNYLPSLTDVRWRIDYVVKSSMVDESEGPMFRVCLVAEESRKRVEYINFTCTSQEMQDLVYKLKDAVRHCQLVTNRIM